MNFFLVDKGPIKAFSAQMEIKLLIRNKILGNFDIFWLKFNFRNQFGIR
jgi:hypothetical protein